MSSPIILSLRARVAMIAAISIAIATTAVTLMFNWRDADRRFASKSAELTTIATSLAATVEPGLTKRDRREVQIALRAVDKMPAIRFVDVTNVDGQQFASFGSGIVVAHTTRASAHPNALQRFGFFSDLTFPLSVPISSARTEIGTLTILADISDLQHAQWESFVAALIGGMGAAVISFFATFSVQGIVTKPIVALTVAMSALRNTNDTSIVVEKQTNDELGELVETFNTMVRTIGERDKLLREQRDSLESTVNVRTHELVVAKLAADSANAAKSDFLAVMSHEIRTPLNGILAMADLLASGGLAPKSQRHAELIQSSGRNLLQIINEILDLSKIEAGHLEVASQPVSIRGVCDDVVRLFGERAASKGLDIAVVARCGAIFAQGDQLRLRQVIANLVNNALKFTTQGHVFIELSQETVTGNAETSRIRVAVHDTGCGIPADKLGSIFEPFVQADRSVASSHGGTGIGLTISKKLVAAMGGELNVRSTPNVGSIFHFALPLASSSPTEQPIEEPAFSDNRQIHIALNDGPSRDAFIAGAGLRGWTVHDLDRHTIGATPSGRAMIVASDALSASSLIEPHNNRLVVVPCSDGDESSAMEYPAIGYRTSWPVTSQEVDAAFEYLDGQSLPSSNSELANARASSQQYNGLRVLAADDNAVNREVLREVLERLGATVTSVENGALVLRQLERQAFDVVFLDGSMPVLDGFSTCKIIREREASAGLPHLPVVALTAHVVGRHSGAWVEAGMDACVTKPFTLADIDSCLQRFFGVTSLEPRTEAPDVVANILSAVDERVIAALTELSGLPLLKTVVALFEEHAPQLVLRLATAIESCNHANVAKESHALKSMAFNVGARRLACMLETIEAQAEEGVESYPVLPDEIEREMHTVLGILKSRVSSAENEEEAGVAERKKIAGTR